MTCTMIAVIKKTYLNKNRLKISGKSKMAKQYNCQKKRNKKTKTNDGQQNTTQKTEDCATRSPLKTWGSNTIPTKNWGSNTIPTKTWGSNTDHTKNMGEQHEPH